MKDLIQKFSGERGEACVTVLVKTHRTHPDNEKDPLELKNLIKEAGRRLLDEYDESTAKHRMAELNKLSDQINHQHNKEGLVLAVNANMSAFYQLPIELDSRVVIDQTFATRDIVRAAHEHASYYALVLSRRQARLIKASSAYVDEEMKGEFPIENETLFSEDKHELSMNKGTDNLIEEFFNYVDKAVQKVVLSDPKPVILVTEERNYHHYMKMADRPIVVGHLNMNRDDEPAHQIIKAAWPVMQNVLKEKNADRVSELKKAVGQQKYLSDLSDIWRAVNEGRGRTLFVERGFFQPARIDNNAVVPVDSPNGNNVVDDIVDEILEVNLKNGGDAVFLKPEEMDGFHGLALTTRF